MSNPHGLDVCRELRKTPGLSEMPIVMASTYPFPLYENKEDMATVDRFVSKPFLPEELKAIIDEVLDARES
jgi:CheY-like chemotaxis protein